MPTNKSSAESNARPAPLRRRPPGYFTCARVIERLQKFQHLVRHHQRWAHEMNAAPPIIEILPEAVGLDGYEQRKLIERQLNRMILIVQKDLAVAGEPTEIVLEDEERDFEYEKAPQIRGKVERQYDLIGDYFSLPQPMGRAIFFDRILTTIERGIGVYEARKDVARREMFNPVHWVGWVLRLPVTLLDAAGLTTDETSSRMTNAYAWVLRIVILAVVAIGLAKLGISVPWDRLLAIFGK